MARLPEADGRSPVARIAVRYINQFSLPVGVTQVHDYLTVYPVVEGALESADSGFFMQLTVPQNDLNATATVTQARIAAPAPTPISVLLDIDVFHVVTEPIDEDYIWSKLEAFRVRKNELFEASITSKTRELIS